MVPFCEANPFRASDGNVVNDTSPIFANAEVVFGSVDWGALIEPANGAKPGIHGMTVARDAGPNNLVDKTRLPSSSLRASRWKHVVVGYPGPQARWHEIELVTLDK